MKEHVAVHGFSQSNQAIQGAKSKQIWIFKRKKVEGREYFLANREYFTPVWSWGRQKSSLLCQAPAARPRSKATRVSHGHGSPDLCLQGHHTINAS